MNVSMRLSRRAEDMHLTYCLHSRQPAAGSSTQRTRRHRENDARRRGKAVSQELHDSCHDSCTRASVAAAMALFSFFKSSGSFLRSSSASENASLSIEISLQREAA